MKEKCAITQRTILQYSYTYMNVIGWAALQHQHELSYCFILRGAGCYWIVLHKLREFYSRGVECVWDWVQQREKGKEKEVSVYAHVVLCVTALGVGVVAAELLLCLFIRKLMCPPLRVSRYRWWSHTLTWALPLRMNYNNLSKQFKRTFVQCSAIFYQMTSHNEGILHLCLFWHDYCNTTNKCLLVYMLPYSIYKP